MRAVRLTIGTLWMPLLAGAAIPAVASAQTRDRAAVISAIDSIADAALGRGRVAGMTIGVVRGNDTLILKGYGYADLELNVPTPSRAIYEIGSITKQFTSSSILQLVEAGKINLEDDMTKYLPDYPMQGHRVTVRRLMDHTSGIRGYTEMPAFGEIMGRALPRDTLVTLFSSQPFDFAPGEALVYNNSAYFLAGLIIEKVSGKSYADYVKENLFDKVGMKDSHYCSETAIMKGKTHGYDMGPRGLQHKGFIVHTYPYSAGSLCSTVGDLIAWNRALHGGKVLSEASYKELMTPGVLNDGSRTRYTMGLTDVNLGGHRAIVHGGGINGFLSAASYYPDHNVIIVVLMNTAGPESPDRIAGDIANLLLGRTEPKSEPFAGDLARLAGTYKGEGRGRDLVVRVVADSGTLKASIGGNPQLSPLRYIGNDQWALNNNLFRFTGPAGSAATGLVVDMVAVYSRLTREPGT